MRQQARRMAGLIRAGAAREHERRGTGRARGTVLAVSPLLIDLHGSDMQLDSSDVTIGKNVAALTFDVGDVLILVEVDTDEWVAVDVEDPDA